MISSQTREFVYTYYYFTYPKGIGCFALPGGPE